MAFLGAIRSTLDKLERPLSYRTEYLPYDLLGEGFRTPALAVRAGLGRGPASESLPWRKPRAGCGCVWIETPYGDLKGGIDLPAMVAVVASPDFVASGHANKGV